MNKAVCTLLYDSDMVFFIEDDSGIWYWSIDVNEYNNYWNNKEKDKDELINIAEFINAPENDTLGCSTSAFHTINEAINHYMEEML